MYQYTRIVSILRETDEPEDVEADFELLTTKDDRYMLSQVWCDLSLIVDNASIDHS